MNEDHALHGGSIVLGASLLGAHLLQGGPLGTGATIGLAMVVLGVRGLRRLPAPPRARLLRRGRSV